MMYMDVSGAGKEKKQLHSQIILDYATNCSKANQQETQMTTAIMPISTGIHRTKSLKNEVIRKANSDRDTGMKNENEREKQGKLQKSVNEAAAD